MPVMNKPSRASATIPGSTVTAILVVGGIVAALYFARDVLVPIALAVLLSFVLAPLVRRLRVWRFPRVIAVFVVAIFAFSIIFGLGCRKRVFPQKDTGLIGRLNGVAREHALVNQLGRR